MSADNGIYILVTPSEQFGYEYRVAHAQAIENIYHYPVGDPKRDVMLARYFGKSELTFNYDNAMGIAKEMHDMMVKDYVIEYGIQVLAFKTPFPDMSIMTEEYMDKMLM